MIFMPQKLKVPGSSYRNFNLPNLSLGAELIENLGTSEEAYKLAPKSAPLAWRVALYTVGRDLEIGEPLADGLPESVKEAGRLVYKDAHDRKARNASGCWQKDGFLYLKRSDAPKGARAPEGFVPGKYLKNIEGFDEKHGYAIKPSPETEEFLIWLPEGEGSFIVPTMDGAYHPHTGTPFETIKDRDKAIKRWVDNGLTEEQAIKELSRFYRMTEGTAAVLSWSNGSYGPLCVCLDLEPWYRISYIGSFAASSLAERSEAGKKSGFVNLEKDEYKSLLEDRAALGRVKKALSK